MILRACYAMDDDDKTTYPEGEYLYEIARSTLSNRRSGSTNDRRITHEHQQKLLSAMEAAVVSWCKEMNDRGFPPRLDR